MNLQERIARTLHSLDEGTDIVPTPTWENTPDNHQRMYLRRAERVIDTARNHFSFVGFLTTEFDAIAGRDV